MSFSKYIILDPLDRLTTDSKWLGFSLSVWASPFLGHFRCVWDERRGQMSPDKHHTCPLWIHTRLILMSFSKYIILDPLDRPTAVSKWLCFSLSVWASPFLGHFRCVWDERRGEMSPATHHTYPLWIHTRLILMSFSKYSALDRPTAVSKWLCFSLSVWAISGVFGMKEGVK
jgi:hypothetical protein